MSSLHPPPPTSKPSLWDQIKSLSFTEEAKRLGQGRIPCARQSLILGLGTGGAISVVGLVARRGVRSSVNWGVLAFLVSSYAKFSTCQYARKAEAERMRIVIEEFNRKKSKNTTNSSSIQEPQAGKSS